MKAILTILFLIAGTAGALAQAAPAATPPPLPPGPLLRPVPDFSRWTITQAGSSGAQAAGQDQADQSQPKKKQAPPETITGERAGDIRHIVIAYANGNEIEFWKKGAVQYVAATGWKVPIVTSASQDEFYGDFGWVSAKNYDGLRKVGGADCMVFHDHILPPGMTPLSTGTGVPLINLPEGFKMPVNKIADPETLKLDAIAYIELDRRVPVALKMGDAVTTYKIEPIDPQVPLQLPPAVQAAMDKQAQQLQAAVRRTVSP